MTSYRCTIPGTYPSLNAWRRLSRWKQYRFTKQWIRDLSIALQEAPWYFRRNDGPYRPLFVGMSELQNRSRVEIELCFRDKRRRDIDNFSPKFLMDALVAIGILVDDSSEWAEPSVRIVNGAKREETVITITPLE